MKQNLIYLLKGLLFSTLIMTALFLFLAFLMLQTQWTESTMSPLVTVAFCLSSFLGGLYFAKHATKRRFVWGVLFGAAFFLIYLVTVFCITPVASLSIDKTLTFLAFALISGCLGGMLS